MQNSYSNKPSNFEEGINLLELIKVVLQGKWIIAFLTAFASIVGVLYSLYLPNIYESKAILVPINSSSGISEALRGYSNLATLAGVNLSSGGDRGDSANAIQKISSLSFFENNILTNIYLPDLMAVKSWNYKTNTVVYDKDIYDTNSNTWIRNFSYPQKQIPSAQESFEAFKTKHLTLSEDKMSGIVTLSIKHQSPFLAKEWVELVVNEINSFFRQKDKLESEKAVRFLNQQILMTSLSEIKQVIAELMQEETKKLALIEANEYYVFDYIDPPASMEKKSSPNRALISIMGLLLGAILGIIIVILRHYAFSKTTS